MSKFVIFLWETDTVKSIILNLECVDAHTSSKSWMWFFCFPLKKITNSIIKYFFNHKYKFRAAFDWYINHTCDKLIIGFRKKYNDDSLNLIGRYNNDKYYNGEIWVLCSLALGQIYIELYKRRNIVKYDSPMHRSRSNPNNNYIEIANQILERILTLEPNLILPEQFNPNTNEMISANKLTWNYSELYKLYKLLD